MQNSLNILGFLLALKTYLTQNPYKYQLLNSLTLLPSQQEKIQGIVSIGLSPDLYSRAILEGMRTIGE